MYVQALRLGGHAPDLVPAEGHEFVSLNAHPISLARNEGMNFTIALPGKVEVYEQD